MNLTYRFSGEENKQCVHYPSLQCQHLALEISVKDTYSMIFIIFSLITHSKERYNS